MLSFNWNRPEGIISKEHEHREIIKRTGGIIMASR
jgi:hypothetical protein